jgi:hypothetical protein
MARAKTEAMITSRVASNAVFSARERLLLIRTITSVAAKTITHVSKSAGTLIVSVPFPNRITLRTIVRLYSWQYSIAERISPALTLTLWKET